MRPLVLLVVTGHVIATQPLRQSRVLSVKHINEARWEKNHSYLKDPLTVIDVPYKTDILKFK